LSTHLFSAGYLVSYAAGSTQIALDLTTPLIIPLLYIGGFFLRNGSVPVYLDWMRYLSWFMYGNEALSINQWSGVSFNDTACPDGVCTGEKILQSYNFNPVICKNLVE
jgi:ABC-type multidrug transport system permease subunit